MGTDAAAAPTRRRSTPTLPARNLVVCCDGTGNEIGAKLSNVMKLYRVSIKDDTQFVYYDPGIGTIARPSTFGRWKAKAKGVFGLATGWELDDDVLDAYRFLCSNYRAGDKIFLFGFSRGAYTVRVLAGMIQPVGLLQAQQANFAGYALKAYKTASAQDTFETAWEFRRMVNGRMVTIDFIGVWDTVASVIVPGRGPFNRLHLQSLPYTHQNPSVKTFRQAMAIDEHRRMFRLQAWKEQQTFQPNPFATVDTPIAQDSLQVWFAGCHSDVGGGYPEVESASAKYPLAWMIGEARASGLKLNTAMVNHIVLGQPRANARAYAAPDPQGMLHNSLTKGWRPLEVLPKSCRFREWPSRRCVLGHYLPRGEPRVIPEGANLHHSVMDRIQLDPQYRPANLPTTYTVIQ